MNATITIAEAKRLIEQAQRDVETILSDLQKQTGLRVDYICMQDVATSEDGTSHFSIYISTSIV